MPIRTKPWTEVTLEDVQDLIDREIREDQTIEFKRQLNLASRDDKAEFLKDVTAMANGVGGTIIYGAVEGEGDRRGQIVSWQGQAADPDGVALQITNILRDSLDERLDGVLFKALSAAEGEYLWVFRIPASPLAPHRVTLGRPQFYLRGSVSNEPMNTRQLREMILQRETAEDKARSLIDERTRALQDAGANRKDDWRFGPAATHPNQVVLHVIPLFPHRNGWGLGPERQKRLMQVRPLGYPEAFEQPFYALEGMYSRFRQRRHVLFLRGGGLEFQQYDVLDRRGGEDAVPRFEAWQVELDVLQALDDCKALTADGLLPLPVVLSLRLLGVGPSVLQRSPRDPWSTDHAQDSRDVFLTPVLITMWGDAARQQVRHVFNEMWQAWHLPESQAFWPDGAHHQYDGKGQLLPHPPGA